MIFYVLAPIASVTMKPWYYSCSLLRACLFSAQRALSVDCDLDHVVKNKGSDAAKGPRRIHVVDGARAGTPR